MTKLRLLLLDDNPDERFLALRELRRQFEQIEIVEAGGREQFEQALEEARFDLVVTDYHMRWTTGMEVLQRVKTRWPRMPVIMFTATGTQEIAVEAMKRGLDDYVIKSPRHYVRLAVAVRSCLDRSEVRLRAIRSETRLQTLLEHARMGLFRLSLDGELLDANRSMRTMLSLGESDGLQDVHHPLLAAARESASELMARGDFLDRDVVIRSGESESAGQNPDKTALYYSLKLVRVPVNGHDAIDGLVDDTTSLQRTHLELSELNRELERRVEGRTRQLSEANETLEAFAYSVSHDLREPVRTLQGFARALHEDLASGRQEDAKLLLERIEGVAASIDGMVADLLEYSTLSRAMLALAPVPLQEALEEACNYLTYDPMMQRAKLSCIDTPWPAVCAHSGTLVQVLVNLLSNAAKFVAPDVQPEITVSAAQAGARVRIEVRDNGIGIPEPDQQRVFDVFQRLHGREAYPGTGIGLALVRKGIERMGGTSGVKSVPGEGSCFWFELDTADPAPPADSAPQSDAETRVAN